MFNNINKPDLFTAGLIAAFLPTYYKLKFLLDGQISWGELLAPSAFMEYLFSSLLAFGLVAIHRFFAKKSRYQFLIVTLASAVMAAIFTWFFFTIVLPFGAPNGFIFDIVILSLIAPLLLSGVRDRIFLTQEAESAKLKAKTAENRALVAQMEVLKTRLSPHFLFNGLNTLADIVEDDPVLAVRFIDRMALVYRYILENENVASIPLKRELEAVRALLFVMETRHPGALRVAAILPEEAGGYEIVPLALQTLVENALKHNIYSPSAPLDLSIRIEDEHLIVENVINIRPNPDSLKSGLDNLAKRMAMLTDGALQYGQENGRFRVKAPLTHVGAS